MKTITFCIGIGLNQLLPEFITIPTNLVDIELILN